jgi:hypothetical protein
VNRHPGGRLRLWLLIGLAACAPWGMSQASVVRTCDQPERLSPAQQDTLLRFGGIVKDELEKSGQRVALISRSGLDLSRFAARYSHAGVSLKASENTPWSVRQLYFACDEQRPRIFDQGMSGFVLGLNDAALGYVSIVYLPAPEAGELERAALDSRLALQLLSPTYSANAYPFSRKYQNCNQWLVELLATTWGRLDGLNGVNGLGGLDEPRAQAQAWLKSQGYTPSVMVVGSRPMMWLGAFMPWVHSDDHPAEDTEQSLYRVSMPASIEAFVRAQVPGATRVELCHTERQVVIRRGWEPIAEGCVALAQDTVITLEP